jgi:uncharacterized membrane protein YsdA (DUF1294 family)
MPWIVLYLSLVVLLSAVTFATYGIDKRRARTASHRVPERTLHLLALLGGWPGALAGQHLFRHKIAKTRFLVLFWLTVFLHLGIVAAVAGAQVW